MGEKHSEKVGCEERDGRQINERVRRDRGSERMERVRREIVKKDEGEKEGE